MPFCCTHYVCVARWFAARLRAFTVRCTHGCLRFGYTRRLHGCRSPHVRAFVRYRLQFRICYAYCRTRVAYYTGSRTCYCPRAASPPLPHTPHLFWTTGSAYRAPRTVGYDATGCISHCLPRFCGYRSYRFVLGSDLCHPRLPFYRCAMPVDYALPYLRYTLLDYRLRLRGCRTVVACTVC